MNCAICGSSNAQENCHGCDAWICADCAHEYDGYYFCPLCYVQRSGESLEGVNEEESFDFDDDDLDFEDGEGDSKGDDSKKG